MEAENTAFCEASKEAVWLDTLIQGVTMLVTQSDRSVGPVNIKVDNSGYIDFAKIPFEHQRTEHFDTRNYFVRDATTTDKVILEHCPTVEMAPDLMTKALAKVKNDNHVKTIGMCSIQVRAVSTSSSKYIAAPRRPRRAASDSEHQDSRPIYFSTRT